MKATTKFQIGKNGITDAVVTALAAIFATHKVVRVSCLKASGRDRASITAMADELSTKLSAQTPYRFEYRVIGFTIVLNRFAQK